MKKTVAVHFHNKRGLQREISLRLGDHNILFHNNVRFLGLTFDHKLSWDRHNTQLKNHCLQSLSLLKCFTGKSWGSDRQSLLHICRASVRSKLDYGSQIYGSAKPYILTNLNSVHHAAIRLCMGAFRSSPRGHILWIGEVQRSFPYFVNLSCA